VPKALFRADFGLQLRNPGSNLCVADKLAFVMTPAWLCLPTAQASGEFGEYMCVASARQSGGQFSDFAPAQVPQPGGLAQKLHAAMDRKVLERRCRPLDSCSSPRAITRTLARTALLRAFRHH
jgi:hypothetical protein